MVFEKQFWIAITAQKNSIPTIVNTCGNGKPMYANSKLNSCKQCILKNIYASYFLFFYAVIHIEKTIHFGVLLWLSTRNYSVS